MRNTRDHFGPLLLAGLLTTGLAGTVSVAQDARPATAASGQELEEVVVTGFRRSLADATAAKRDSVGFVDSVFAEDIGKFPDTNLAESFNRIPGVTISREITGEGLNVAIRGLNTNFTRVLLNGAPMAVAAAGQDATNQNREVDLDLMPSELFSQLTVAKTPTADLVEGGAAGTINMRMSRPFDHEGSRLAYSIQGMDNQGASDMGYRGSLVGSYTWGETFGVLVGFSGVQNKVDTTGFETVGWTSLNLTPAQCGAATCNPTGGAGAGPGTLTTVPDNASTRAAGLTPGATIDSAFLLAQNPGTTLQQLDNALIPRLGRPMFDRGTKDRYSGVISLEWRPTDDLKTHLDTMYGKRNNDLERVDMMWAVRRTSQGGLIIPQNMHVDNANCAAGCVATSGTFPNSQFLLEYRPYTEDLDFWGTNPGFSWQMSDSWRLDFEANYTKSKFHRQDPTVLVLSKTSIATYTNDGGVPHITSSIDLNDPANFQWAATDRGPAAAEVGRTDMVDEARETETKGGRFGVTWGDDKLNLKFGGAWDETGRDIQPLANSQQFQNGVCGGDPNVFVPAPNTQPGCRGETASQITPGVNNYPTYPGLGTGVSSGEGPLAYAGSLVPNASVPNYLLPTDHGFVAVNWPSFRAATSYDAVHALEGDAGATPTTANWGRIDERVSGVFAQVSGDHEVSTHRLRYNLGLRWVQTDQSVTSRLTVPDTRNPSPPTAADDGSRYPDVQNLVELDRRYRNLLPSGNLAWNVTDDAIVRAGLSRTLTRANPSAMLLGLSIPNADVSQVNLGNPDLDPYISDNLDIGFEYYTGEEGYFGVAAFRKVLDGFTTRQTTTVTFGDLAQYGVTLDSLGASQRDAVNNRGGNAAPVQLNQTVNASGKLTISGLEFNWVQPLDFGNAALEGLGFTANYTFIDQHGSGAAPAIAIGVPPQTWNGTLYYENHGISARASITEALGSQASGPNSNQQQVTGAELFTTDYKQIDASLAFDMSKMFHWSEFVPQLIIEGQNLTNEKRDTYFQFTDALYSEFDSGRTIMFGLRGSF